MDTNTAQKRDAEEEQGRPAKRPAAQAQPPTEPAQTADAKDQAGAPPAGISKEAAREFIAQQQAEYQRWQHLGAARAAAQAAGAGPGQATASTSSSADACGGLFPFAGVPAAGEVVDLSPSLTQPMHNDARGPQAEVGTGRERIRTPPPAQETQPTQIAPDTQPAPQPIDPAHAEALAFAAEF